MTMENGDNILCLDCGEEISTCEKCLCCKDCCACKKPNPYRDLGFTTDFYFEGWTAPIEYGPRQPVRNTRRGRWNDEA